MELRLDPPSFKPFQGVWNPLAISSGLPLIFWEPWWNFQTHWLVFVSFYTNYLFSLGKEYQQPTLEINCQYLKRYLSVHIIICSRLFHSTDTKHQLPIGRYVWPISITQHCSFILRIQILVIMNFWLVNNICVQNLSRFWSWSLDNIICSIVFRNVYLNVPLPPFWRRIVWRRIVELCAKSLNSAQRGFLSATLFVNTIWLLDRRSDLRSRKYPEEYLEPW